MRENINEVFWKEAVGEPPVFKYGFTTEFLERTGIIWNFIPSVPAKTRVLAGQPLACIESSKRLLSIKVPEQAAFIGFDKKVLNAPDKLTSEDYIYMAKPQ